MMLKKRIASLLLAAALLAGLVLPAGAETPAEQNLGNDLPIGDLWQIPEPEATELTAAEYATAETAQSLWEADAALYAASGEGTSYRFLDANEKAVYDAFLACSGDVVNCAVVKIDAALKVTNSQMMTGVNAALNDHPEVFWTGGKWAYSYQKSNDQTIVVGVCLSKNARLYTTEKDLAKGKQQFDSAVNLLLAKVDTDASAPVVAMRVHDVLANAVVYDQAGADDKSAYMPHTAYNALVEGTAVCDGYAKSYLYLLRQCGIESAQVSSSSLNHGWNLVLFDTDWYETDVTWDDSRSNHDFYDLTTATMASANKHNGSRDTDSVTGKLPTAQGTLYTYTYVSAMATPTATPTAAPTAAPTASPTAAPTATPTATPTAAPTATPTATPTAAPTATPTATPTAAPTATPTAKPTASPTATPTAKPTATPTATPTAAPTATPTASPTAKPTAAPTAAPTAKPTAAPTATPTAKPTATPTAAPTAKPTATPTASPTAKPTAVPTATPTAAPTATPTATPTAKPTAAPTGVETFVTRLYEVCLNRAPDAAGKTYWVDKLESKAASGTQAAYGFVFSNEFKAKNYCNEDYAKQLYRAFMGREFDQSGLDNWVGKMASGTTREEVFNGFSQSTEFAKICATYGITLGDPIAIPQYGTVPTGACSVCGAQDGVTAFVTRLYSVCLDRKPDNAGLKDWTNKLWNHTQSGRDVAYGFIFSKEFTGKNYSNADYVEYLYKAFMDRSSDAAGKADWLNRMKQGWTREQVFDGFVGSQEFTKICNSYGIVRG